MQLAQRQKKMHSKQAILEFDQQRDPYKVYEVPQPTLMANASDDDVVPNKPNLNNGVTSFILKTKNDFKPKNKTICCNSVLADDSPLELEFEESERPITHRQMNGTRLGLNKTQSSHLAEKKLVDQERSSNQSRSLYAKTQSCYFEPAGRFTDMDEHSGKKTQDVKKINHMRKSMAPAQSSTAHKSSFVTALKQLIPSPQSNKKANNGSESSSNATSTMFGSFHFPRTNTQQAFKSSRVANRSNQYVTHSSINLRLKPESDRSLNKSSSNFHEQFIKQRMSANASCHSISSQISQSVKISQKRSPSKFCNNSNENYVKNVEATTPSGQLTTRTNTAATPCPYYELTSKMRTEKQKSRKQSAGFFSTHLQSLFSIDREPEESKKEEEQGYETECNPDYVRARMNPTKIAEKNWEHSYKLAQLIRQQEKFIEKDSWMVEQFGGINQRELHTAFQRNLGKNSAGHQSVLSIALSNRSRSPRSQFPLSCFSPTESIPNMQDHASDGSSEQSDRSERFVNTTKKILSQVQRARRHRQRNHVINNTEKTKQLDFKQYVNPEVGQNVMYKEKVAEIPKLQIHQRKSTLEKELNPDDFVLESSPTANGVASKTMSPTTEYERESSPDTVEENTDGSHSSELDECKAHTSANDLILDNYDPSVQPVINQPQDSPKNVFFDMLSIDNKRSQCRNLPENKPRDKLKKTVSAQQILRPTKTKSQTSSFMNTQTFTQRDMFSKKSLLPAVQEFKFDQKYSTKPCHTRQVSASILSVTICKPVTKGHSKNGSISNINSRSESKKVTFYSTSGKKDEPRPVVKRRQKVSSFLDKSQSNTTFTGLKTSVAKKKEGQSLKPSLAASRATTTGSKSQAKHTHL